MANHPAETRSDSKRVALYARVSTTDKGQNPDVQLSPLRDYAKARGWKIVEEFVDRGVSGSKVKRPGLDRMMSAVEAREIDVVLVWRFDRFARSTRHLLDALERFRALNVDFVSTQESVDTSTPMGRAVFTILSAIAELERELIRERVIAGLEEARRRGQKLGRRAIEIDLRQAAALLKSGDYTAAEVAETMKVSESTLRRRLAEAGVLVER